MKAPLFGATTRPPPHGDGDNESIHTVTTVSSNGTNNGNSPHGTIRGKVTPLNHLMADMSDAERAWNDIRDMAQQVGLLPSQGLTSTPTNEDVNSVFRKILVAKGTTDKIDQVLLSIPEKQKKMKMILEYLATVRPCGFVIGHIRLKKPNI